LRSSHAYGGCPPIAAFQNVRFRGIGGRSGGRCGLDGDSAAWVLGQALFARRVFDIVKLQKI